MEVHVRRNAAGEPDDRGAARPKAGRVVARGHAAVESDGAAGRVPAPARVVGVELEVEVGAGAGVVHGAGRDVHPVLGVGDVLPEDVHDRVRVGDVEVAQAPLVEVVDVNLRCAGYTEPPGRACR